MPLQPRVARRSRRTIREQKAAYLEEWLRHDTQGRVNPARFFASLRRQLADDATVVLDDGNHTFLAAELMPIHRARGLISPTDFNCMGYCVPATIGAKLARPDAPVVGIVGDGAFRMTAHGTGDGDRAASSALVVFVFNDGELAQIAQAQEIPYNRKTCTVLGPLDIAGVAQATGAKFLRIGERWRHRRRDSRRAGAAPVVSASRCSSTSSWTTRSARASPRASSRPTSSASTSGPRRDSSVAPCGGGSAADLRRSRA